jgi:hypothetical protein
MPLVFLASQRGWSIGQSLLSLLLEPPPLQEVTKKHEPANKISPKILTNFRLDLVIFYSPNLNLKSNVIYIYMPP